jgi:hypothetical protein
MDMGNSLGKKWNGSNVLLESSKKQKLTQWMRKRKKTLGKRKKPFFRKK